jgi:hypothetical protein
MARGRQSKEVEFLRTLRDLMGLNQSNFAKACGKKSPNMYKYLAGQLQPGKKVLASCVRNIFEWAVQPLMEIQSIPKNLNDLPKTSGLYILYDSAGGILYIGKATNFRAEIRQTLGRRLRSCVKGGHIFVMLPCGSLFTRFCRPGCATMLKRCSCGRLRIKHTTATSEKQNSV